jgi:RNA polymerase sigma factor (sigma-70 family)
MLPPNPNYGKKLDPKRQKFFNEHLFLAKEVAGKFYRHHSNLASFDDVHQIAREGVWKAARLVRDIDTLNSANGYVAKWIWRRLNGHFFNPMKSVKEARMNEVVGSTPAAAKESEEDRTVIDLAADQLGEREIASDPGNDRLASRRADIREAITKAPGLEARERRALRLRFILGLDHEAVAARMGLSGAFLKVVVRSGVRKLRAHFQSLGLETLPVDAPLPCHGNEPGLNQHRSA